MGDIGMAIIDGTGPYSAVTQHSFCGQVHVSEDRPSQIHVAGFMNATFAEAKVPVRPTPFSPVASLEGSTSS